MFEKLLEPFGSCLGASGGVHFSAFRHAPLTGATQAKELSPSFLRRKVVRDTVPKPSLHPTELMQRQEERGAGLAENFQKA